MKAIINKVNKNIRSGTLLKNGTKALKNRLLKKLRGLNFIYIFNPERVQTKKYLSSFPKIDSNHLKMGNYFVDQRLKLNEHSIVYSLGILTDVSFDLAVSNKFGCDIYMFDPTPISIDYMKQFESNNKFKFFPNGVWIEQGTLKFYEPKLGGSSSLLNSETSSDNYFEAECLTVQQIMKKFNHTHINLFKADIEGAALPIVEQLLAQNIYPDQLILEFERPKGNLKEIDLFFKRVDEIRLKLKERNYLEYQLPRKIAKYFSLEILFISGDSIATLN